MSYQTENIKVCSYGSSKSKLVFKIRPSFPRLVQAWQKMQLPQYMTDPLVTRKMIMNELCLQLLIHCMQRLTTATDINNLMFKFRFTIRRPQMQLVCFSTIHLYAFINILYFDWYQQSSNFKLIIQITILSLIKK